MAGVDLSGWPVVAVSLDDVQSTGELAALLGAVITALERHEPFGLVIASEVPLGAADEPDSPLRVVRRRRTEVGTWYRGVVYVLPGRAAEAFAAAQYGEARRLWGATWPSNRTSREAVRGC
jgi:hypothetical protein